MWWSCICRWGLRSELCINLFLCDSGKVEVHLHSVLCTEPEPLIGDCCHAFVRFSSVHSTSWVSPLNMLLGCAQYRSFSVTLLNVVILSVGHFNCKSWNKFLYSTELQMMCAGYCPGLYSSEIVIPSCFSFVSCDLLWKWLCLYIDCPALCKWYARPRNLW